MKWPLSPPVLFALSSLSLLAHYTLPTVEAISRGSIPLIPGIRVPASHRAPLFKTSAGNHSLRLTPSSPPAAVFNSLRNEWIGDGHLQFTFDLLNGFMNSLDLKTGNLESIAFSPFSIQSILMMIHLGAKGQTKSEIAKVLHIDASEHNVTFSKSHEAFGKAVRSLMEDGAISKCLHSANQIFVQEGLSISNSYSLALKHYHMGFVKYVNFAKDSYGVLNLINEWIEKQTAQMITNFLTTPPSPMTSLMAVNAIRFKGEWQYRFDPTDTESKAWFRMINGHTAKVDMMVAQLPLAFAYNAPLQTSIIELPFKTSRLSFFVLLPDDTFGLFSLLGSLNATVFANLIFSMRKVNNHASGAANEKSPSGSSSTPAAGVNVRLPKFAINSMPKITSVLRNQMGLKSLFSDEDANLEAMFSRPLFGGPGSGQIYMDELLHKAILKVDEVGSVGAAVSASSIERVGTFTGPYFEADHPFVYLLMDKQTGLALFAGFYAGPSGAATSVTGSSNNNKQANEPHSSGNFVQNGGKIGQAYAIFNNNKNERNKNEAN